MDGGVYPLLETVNRICRYWLANLRHIDTSLNYRNQVGTGLAIKRSGIPRDQLYITSKYDAVNGTDVTHEIHTTLNQVSEIPGIQS